MRLVVDIGKIASLDGLGSYTRGLVDALTRRAVDDPGLELAFVDLLGEPTDQAVEAGERLVSLESLSSDDVLLALTWSRPATFEGRALFVVYDLTFLTLPACHTVDNRIHCLEGCLQAALADDLFVAISQATADELIAQLGVPSRRVEVVHPAPAALFTTGQDAPREGAAARVAERHGLPGEDADGYVLAVGSLEPRKNLETLLDAHALLPADLARRFPLAIVGGGGWRNEALLARLDAAAEAGSLHRLGQPSDDELADLYTAATLFAYPSLAEGFGLPIVEAMACGCPVVAGDHAVIREVAADAARRVDVTSAEALARALRELLEARGEREHLAAAGRDRAASFTWNETARRIVDAARPL